MNILITGAAGFLGMHLAQYFATKTKGKLYLLDIAPFAKREYPEQSIFIEGDVRDSKIVGEIMSKVDAVIHAAAALPLWSASEIMDINVNGTRTLLEHAYTHKVKRFLYISSTAVYGVPKKHPILETDPRVGVGPYGESKIQSEELCEEYRKRGTVITIIRPKTFVGTHRLGVFEILFDWVHDGKRIPVIGSGKNTYQLLDVDDLVEAVYLCILSENTKIINDNFNIGAEKYKTVEEDLQELFDSAKSGSRIFPTPAAPIKSALYIFEQLKLSPLYQWVYDTADKDSFVSIEKLTKVLKWHPKYSNGQALIKAYKWYLDNYSEIKSRGSGVTHMVGWKQGVLGLFKKFM